MREESPNPEIYRNQSMKDSLVKEDTLEDSSVKRVSTFYEKNASDFSGFEGRVIQERFQENPEESEHLSSLQAHSQAKDLTVMRSLVLSDNTYEIQEANEPSESGSKMTHS